MRIVQSATPSTSVHFRKSAYGRNGVQTFLRDVIAIANASIDGTRYIITGVEFDHKGRRRLCSIDAKDFSGKPAYQSLANDHIEPPLRLQYQSVVVDGERLGVFEIGDCQDRPYMMRIDYSETLRRGDAYARVNNSTVKLGRRQLQALFEERFSDSISAANIEIGFPGSIIHKEKKFTTCNLSELPSAVASSKLQELIEAKTRAHASVSTTVVDRLTHARLFGTGPYEKRSNEEIIAEMNQLERQYCDHDDQFLYDQPESDLQLVAFNQGEEPIREPSLTLLMPNHDAFYVATRLPKIPRGKKFVDRTPAEQADYPVVNLHADSIQIAVQFDDIPPGEPINIFATPLRVCAGDALKGRRLGIRYKLSAQNLRSPTAGKLRLLMT